MSSQILLTEISPHDNLQAIVEQDERVVYFYLEGHSESPFGVRSCWIRNLQPAPLELDVAEMEKGIPPRLPKKFCSHPQGAPPFKNKENLRVVWFVEGDGAVLLEGSDILAVIPSWSGVNNFQGYARDCRGESSLCWQLNDAEEVMEQRIAKAENFWRTWTSGEATWVNIKSNFLKAYQNIFGQPSAYYSIDNEIWPPKALLETQINGNTVLTTIGVSIRPQPQVEKYFNPPEPHQRIELGICLSKVFSKSFIEKVSSYICSLTNFPWHQFTFFADGHTIPWNLFDDFKNSKFDAALLCRLPHGAPVITLPTMDGDPVNLLWLIPITSQEQNLAVKQDSKALLKLLSKLGNYWMCHPRKSLIS